MKKIVLFALCYVPNILYANPIFPNGERNCVGLYVAQSTGYGDLANLVLPTQWDFGPMTMVMFQYSQPVSFFRLPSRINLDVLQNFSYNSAKGASFAAIGISLDVVLLSWCGWYVGVGLGPYMRDSGDDFVESRLVFGERFFIGKNITQRFNAEIFTQHFSNGDFTSVNRGFNFVGVGVNFAF